MTAFIAFVIGAALVAALWWMRSRLAGFMSQDQESYADGPVFDLRRDLSGDMVCDGVIYGPLGRVVSRFTADVDVAWDGNRGVMRERFVYDSGTRHERSWVLTVGSDGAITAQADDAAGAGQQAGSAVRMTYRIRLLPQAGGHLLDVTDWMYMTPSGVIVNRSQFRKFGFMVAELVATLRPRADAPS
ncbi:MAG: DUF3833 family protein [Paracoccaceae bacterium]